MQANSGGGARLKRFSHGLLPLAVLLLGALLTVGAVLGWAAALDAQEKTRFAHEAEALQSLINRRLVRVVNGLNDIAAVHAVTGRLSTADLRLYLSKRGLGLFDSGIRGFGVIEHVQRPEVQAFERRERATGDPAFAVHANGGDAPDLFVVRSLEPAASNRLAIGFDVGSIPPARRALEHAVDTGAATFTEPLTLLQDEQKGLGMVLYLPVYRGSPRTAKERRQALELVLFAPVVAREMLGSAAKQLGFDLDLWLYDESDGRRLLFSDVGAIQADRSYLSSRQMQLGDRTFVLDVAAVGHPHSTMDLLGLWGIAILGAGLTLALAVLTWLLEAGRAKAEVQADTSEHFLRTITDHLPARISYWDKDGRCGFANLRFREVYGVGDMELCSFHEFLARRMDEARPHEQLVLQGMPQQFEQELVEADGRTSTWQVHYIPDFEGDAVQGYFVLASEVTELKKARDNALRASNAKTQFLATMSHEIRTPMTGVLGMVDLLQQEDLPAKLRRFVDAIGVSGRHLLHVINDILDFSRLQSGRLQLEDTTFCIADVIEQVRSITAPLAHERQLACSFDIDPGVPPQLRGDPTRLRQVLLNIVGNAVKFTERGSVTILARPAAPVDASGLVRLRFQVEDTGIGIAPEYLRNVFNAFDQADNSTARRYGGSGLGLAISQQIVRTMGGEITVRSEPGQGSTFSFEIALHPAAGSHTEGASPGTSSPVLRPLCLLVVEDVAVNREILGLALRRAGHTVVFAHDGREAVDRVRSQRFDLVLMDVQMPVMDGVQATRAIRRLGDEYVRLPIVGLTASVMAHERESYLAAGMDACLRKPIVWDELWTTLAQQAGGTPTKRQPTDKPMDADAAVLVDVEVIDKLGKLAGPPALSKMLTSTLETAAGCCNDAEDEGGTLAARAHKLKGTAGTFGLLRLSALAERVETLALQPGDVRPSVVALTQAVRETRLELTRLGLLAAASARAGDL